MWVAANARQGFGKVQFSLSGENIRLFSPIGSDQFKPLPEKCHAFQPHVQRQSKRFSKNESSVNFNRQNTFHYKSISKQLTMIENDSNSARSSLDVASRVAIGREIERNFAAFALSAVSETLLHIICCFVPLWVATVARIGRGLWCFFLCVLVCIFCDSFSFLPIAAFSCWGCFWEWTGKCRFANRLLETVAFAIRGGMWLCHWARPRALASPHFSLTFRAFSLHSVSCFLFRVSAFDCGSLETLSCCARGLVFVFAEGGTATPPWNRTRFRVCKGCPKRNRRQNVKCSQPGPSQKDRGGSRGTVLPPNPLPKNKGVTHCAFLWHT